MRRKRFLHSDLSAAAAVCTAAALVYLSVDLVLVNGARALLQRWLAGPGAGAPAAFYETLLWLATLGTALLATLAPVGFAVYLGGLHAQEMALCRPRRALTLPAAGLFLGGSVLLNFVAGLVGERTGSVQQYTLPQTPAAFFAAFCAIVVVPAVTEEVLFRGALRALMRPHGAWLAVVAQAVLFALLHGKLSAVVYALPAGLFLGYLAEACGSIYPGMLLHFLNNLFAFIILALNQNGLSGLATLFASVEAIAFPLFAAVVLVQMLCNKKLLPRLPQGTSPLHLVRCPAFVIGAAGILLYDLLHL